MYSIALHAPIQGICLQTYNGALAEIPAAVRYQERHPTARQLISYPQRTMGSVVEKGLAGLVSGSVLWCEEQATFSYETADLSQTKHPFYSLSSVLCCICLLQPTNMLYQFPHTSNIHPDWQNKISYHWRVSLMFSVIDTLQFTNKGST